MRKRAPEEDVAAARSCYLHRDLTWTLEERPCAWSHGRSNCGRCSRGRGRSSQVEVEADPTQERGSQSNRPWLLNLALSVGTWPRTWRRGRTQLDLATAREATAKRPGSQGEAIRGRSSGEVSAHRCGAKPPQ